LKSRVLTQSMRSLAINTQIQSCLISLYLKL
jgi:hypothetical protein